MSIPNCPWCEDRLTVQIPIKEKLRIELETKMLPEQDQIQYLINLTRETNKEEIRHAAIWLLQNLFRITPADAYAEAEKQAA